jgi:hypothetical protein
VSFFSFPSFSSFLSLPFRSRDESLKLSIKEKRNFKLRLAARSLILRLMIDIFSRAGAARAKLFISHQEQFRLLPALYKDTEQSSYLEFCI